MRRLADHVSTGPRSVFDQSMERMSAPISPPPAKQSVSVSGAAGLGKRKGGATLAEVMTV